MANSIFGNPTLGGTNAWTGSNTFAYTILTDGAPTPTTNRLYNVGGALYFNGSLVAGGTAYWSRGGTTLTPATAGDSITAYNITSTGDAIQGKSLLIGSAAKVGSFFLGTDYTTYVQAAAGTITTSGPWTIGGNLLAYPDASFDFGAAASGRFRDLFLSRNATIGGTLTVTGASPKFTLTAYVNDAAAGVGGLTTGMLYQVTGTGVVMVKQ